MCLSERCKKAATIFQAVFIVYALQMSYGEPLQITDFKSGMHYLYARVTGLLGEYRFTTVILFVIVVFFLFEMRKGAFQSSYKGKVLPLFFAFCYLVGESYYQCGDWSLCFGDELSVINFVISMLGFTFLFRYLLCLTVGLYQRASETSWTKAGLERFFGKKCFRNVFLLLMMIWFPILLLSFPGNLCYDGLGQIEQALGYATYSTHHPLLSTLLMGTIIKVIAFVTGSRDLGLFAYILFQAVTLAMALAGTVVRLSKRRVSMVLRLVVVGIYVFSPMYSNMVSTAIKDVPFMAAVIWYILLLEELVANGLKDKKAGFWIQFVAVQILVSLLRNNGIYMVALTGVGSLLFFWKKTGRKQRMWLLSCLIILPLMGYVLINGGLKAALNANSGKMAEMFSIPFQQTARYLQFYRTEITVEERLAIEGVLGDVNKVASEYNPKLADPVKALYQKNVGTKELLAYLIVWMKGFFQHPAVYLQAFFAHVYGWFDPGVSNAIRYEAESELFLRRGLIPGADKVLLFVYRFAEYVPFLAILENVGFYTWLLLLLAGEEIRKKSDYIVLTFPLFVTLLVCMASPCFYLHPRYAYPIMFTIPFLYGVTKGGQNSGNQ